MNNSLFDYLRASHLRKAMGSFFIAGIIFFVIGCLFLWIFLEGFFVFIWEYHEGAIITLSGLFLIAMTMFAVAYGCFWLSGFLRRPGKSE